MSYILREVGICLYLNPCLYSYGHTCRHLCVVFHIASCTHLSSIHSFSQVDIDRLIEMHTISYLNICVLYIEPF